MKHHRFLALAICLLALLPSVARAGIEPSSVVLVPYFEVDIGETLCRTTYFAVSNHSQSPHQVEVEVLSNWGIVLLTVRQNIDANGVLSVDLADWLVRGNLPDRQLSDEEIAHLQAALTGKPSPRDGLYYGSETTVPWAIGAVRIRVVDKPAADVLWGDYIIYCKATPMVQGETLVNLDYGVSEHLPCARHGIRFLDSDSLNTELLFWSALHALPSEIPELPLFNRLAVTMEVFDEAGALLETRQLNVLPLERLRVEDLGLPAHFGWLELSANEDFFVTSHVSQIGDLPVSLGLHSYCLPEVAAPGPGIRIVKRVNDQRAGSPPGVVVAIGGMLQWEYTVANTGAVTLTGVHVEDDALSVVCPKDTLEAGETMVCTASSNAEACQHRNVAVAFGTAPDGTIVQDQDVGNYYGDPEAAVDIEKLVGEEDADSPPGPRIRVGTPVSFRYVVTNTGATRLTDIVVSDDQGFAVTCPKSSLEPGESMTCSAQTTAVVGSHRDVGAVAALDLCGMTVNDQDPAHYLGWKPAQGITIEKATNGQDADTRPGPSVELGAAVTWSYLVTNTGEVELLNVTVTDDQGVAVTCPKTVLAPGESMTCTGSGVATACQYDNLGTVIASTGEGDTVTAQDPSHYFGQHHAAVTLEKLTNGEDADEAPGPGIAVGDTVQWTYVVTNTGDVALTEVVVSDSRDAALTCPKTTLQPAESMTCTASGTAVVGQYRNVGAVTANPPCGEPVSAQDPSHYYGRSPSISLEKLTNGEEADLPQGPKLIVGAAVLWTYVVTNTGDVALSDVMVTDDKGVTVSCPKTTLAPAESMTCTATGTAAVGQYENLGTVTGKTPFDVTVTAADPSHYFGENPGISLEKRVNGQDADVPPGPTLFTDSPVSWTYMVTNTGDVALTNVMVTDDHGVVVTCPKTTLAPGESMTCTASGLAAAGQYMNVGTATGTPPTGPDVTATDPAHYLGVTPRIGLEKLVNGEDADTVPGPIVPLGSTVVFTYVVTNLGDIALSAVAVSDNVLGPITCPKTTLTPGETMTCIANALAESGQHANIGTASGMPAGGSAVTDADPGHYLVLVAFQGCTPGYWKNHTDSWPPTGYSTSQAVDSVFANVNTYYPALGNATLLQALAFAGGPGGEGAAEILLRAGVAALLNASHPGVGYPLSPANVIAEVNAALLQNRDSMLALAAALDANNNLGCPLN